MKKKRIEDEVYAPIKVLPLRPKQDMRRPLTRDEQLFCWHHWITIILNPAYTRYVLDELETIPTFNATWGSDSAGRRKPYKKRMPMYKTGLKYV